MFLDASAIIAILAREGDGAALAARLGQAAKVHTSPVAVYEAVLGLARIGNVSLPDAETVLDHFLREAQAEIAPIDAELGRRAIRAFERFGKGRHPAGLNMGDCFAYACAEALQAPLLFKGDDFPRTDIVVG
ncbi:MAG: type II toxin-antitoxin system VapC family toxin [Pseudomonadota bacterium]|nr:type II toxin-antitoxin system VapC family toxin [Pseudomonadota bacterium]